MQYETNLTPAQRELEQELRTLAARPGQIDAIAAAFVAGQRSQMRNVRIWRSAAGLLLLIAAGSFLLPAGRTDKIVPTGPRAPIAVNSTLPPAPQVSNQSLLILQETISRRGVDALPESRLPTVRSMGSNETL
jgi:hypothetical protein